MPFDPREFSESLRLETVITSAEIELENSLVYALYSKAQEFDNAQLRNEINNYIPKNKVSKELPGYSGTIPMPISPQSADIDWNIKRARMSWSPSWFIERLAPGGEMDYKAGRGNIIYEDFGNFNYGAVALAFGLSESAALRGAGLIQIIVNAERLNRDGKMEELRNYVLEHGVDFMRDVPYGDQKKDQEMIRQGFRYYKEVYLWTHPQQMAPEEYKTMKQIMAVEESESFYRGMRKIGDILKGLSE